MRVEGSFTIEAAVVLAVIFVAIALIIGVAFDKRAMVVAGVEMHFMMQEIAHDEEQMGYDKERLKSNGQRNITAMKGYEDAGIECLENPLWVTGRLQGSKQTMSLEMAVFNPEGYMRATTAMEGIYERYRDQLSENPES